MTNRAANASLQTADGPSATRARLLALLGAAGRILVFSVALWVLYRALADVSLGAVRTQIASLPLLALAISVALQICYYALTTAQDAVALRYLNLTVPYRRSALIAFLALALGDNVRVASQSAASIRQRLYSGLGLSASQLTRLVFFLVLSTALGWATMAGLALLMLLPGQEASPGSPLAALAPAGVLLLALPMLYVAFALLRRVPVVIASWEMAVPSPQVLLSQLGLSSVSQLFAAATLYVLLAAVADIGFAYFLPAWLLATAAGQASRSPGGLGVIEAVLFLALPQVPPAALLSAMIVYRCVSYLAPLLIASIVVLQQPGRLHWQAMGQPATQAANAFSSVVPQLVGTLVFLAGVVLLVTVARPPDAFHAAVIAKILPLPVLELSYLLGGVVGAGLLFLAHGLCSRLHAAYLATLAALPAGVIILLFAGPAYIVASVLAMVSVALFVSRTQFFRRQSLVRERFPLYWFSSVVIGIGLAIWVGLVSYREVDYANELWLRFDLDAAPARSLRAIVVAVLAAVGGLSWSLLSKRHTTTLPASLPRDTSVVLPVLLASQRAAANLALVGDKRFLWSDDGRAFLMYQVSGDSWVACGDPLGPPGYEEELVQEFDDMVRRHYGRPLFYQVGEELLPLYIDTGLAVTKVAEEARVRLRTFSVQESQNAELARTVGQIREYGFELEIVPSAEVPWIAPDLRQISERWIADKYATEKRFSVGSFSEEYIAHFDCAVVRIDGTIVAFANIWPAPGGKELALDLLRYSQMAPKGIVEFLFAELMSWGRENDYKWFSLGMAPLVGQVHRPLASLRQKLDNVICSHSDNFYDVQVLRTFKNQFKPVWRPRYLVSPPGLWQLPNALLDTSRMISGGVVGMFESAQGG